MHPTHSTLAESIRAQSIELLSKDLATAIDLHAQARQAHWDVGKPTFIAVHELLHRRSSVRRDEVAAA